MPNVLLFPMNTNHVVIMENIIQNLDSHYDVLCHDNVCFGPQYFTESTLQERRIAYHHFDERCTLSYGADVITQIRHYLKIKRIVEQKINLLSPDVIVFCLDNDPVAQIAIKWAKRVGVKTVLIQDGLIRPEEYTKRRHDLSTLLYAALQQFGISVKSIVYGTGGCDNVLVNGKIAYEVLKTRGVSQSTMSVIGQPKYDEFLRRVSASVATTHEEKTYLFAATKELIRDDENILFLKRLIRGCRASDIRLIVKMHPRAPEQPEHVLELLRSEDLSYCDVIKGGDDTADILRKSSGVITLSSTVILEALILDKEGIAVHYLTGEQNLRHYDKYEAIHVIDSPDDVPRVIARSLESKKDYANKKRLLEDELYSLDGKSSHRAAGTIDSLAAMRRKHADRNGIHEGAIPDA